jgi:hypothetical protein
VPDRGSDDLLGQRACKCAVEQPNELGNENIVQLVTRGAYCSAGREEREATGGRREARSVFVLRRGHDRNVGRVPVLDIVPAG